MLHPLHSLHRQRQLVNISLRLFEMFEALGEDHIRRSRSVAASVAGPWRRTLQEAETILGPVSVPLPSSQKPADFFVSVLANLHALQRLKRLHEKGFRRKYGGVIPGSRNRSNIAPT